MTMSDHLTSSNGLCLREDQSHCSQWFFPHTGNWSRCECHETLAKGYYFINGKRYEVSE